jgi:5,10-methylenetetrahydromethanopterin reductase
MQGCVAEPLLRFFRRTVAEGAHRAGRDPAQIELVARLNVCVSDDVPAARNAMRPTVVRSLVAQRPDFFTFRTAGLELPEPLRAHVLSLPYTHDVAPLLKVAPLVPDAFVDAVTLAGSAAEVAEGVARLARGGIGQLMVYPVAFQGSIVGTIERFQSEVMPAVRKELERS